MNPAMLSEIKIGFLGAGKMAAALAKGFVRAGLTTPDRLIASDVAEAARVGFQNSVAAPVAHSNLEVARSAQVLLLAVKPGQVRDVLLEIQPAFTEKHLLISIAAGIRLGALEQGLPARSRVVRVMPNTPALVGASATGFTPGTSASREDASLVQTLFSAVGVACELPEELLDAVTGLSGSGPAYIYTIIEALSDGGVAAGLPREIATRLAAQTVMGAAKMVLETGLHTGVLKDMVTSPGGTTIEGIHEIEKGSVRGVLMNAVRAASDKSKKLGAK